MIVTLEKGKPIIGTDFVAHTPQFDVLHTQTREIPMSPLMPSVDMHTQEKKSGIEPPVEKNMSQPTENIHVAEHVMWSVPQSFVDEVSSIAEKNGNESRKIKLVAFKFDVEDDISPATVAEKIHEAVDYGVLTHDEGVVLFGLLRQDAEKKGFSALPTADLTEEDVVEPVESIVQEPGAISPVEEVMVPTQELVHVDHPQSVHVTAEVTPGGMSLDGTIEYTEPSIESLNEKVKEARGIYISLYAEVQKDIDAKKTAFEKNMTDLGKPGRQMPQLNQSVDFVRAKEVYENAQKKVLEHMRAHGASMSDQLDFLETEKNVFEKSVHEGSTLNGSRVLQKALGKFSGAPLPDRFSVGSKALGSVAEGNSLTGGPFLVSSITPQPIIKTGKFVDGIQKSVGPKIVPIVAMPVEVSQEEPVDIPNQVIPIPQEVVMSMEATRVDQPSEVLIEDVPMATLVADIPPASSVPEKNSAVVESGGGVNENYSDMLDGKAPLSVAFQFDDQYKNKRTEYSTTFHKALISVPEGVIDFSLPINYMGGQIVALQQGDALTVLLNGEKIGEGTASDGNIKLKYLKPVNDPVVFGMKSNFETAFEFAQAELQKKASLFKKVL